MIVSYKGGIMNPVYTVKVCITLRVDADADVIEALEESGNKTDLVRQAIREKMAREGK